MSTPATAEHHVLATRSGGLLHGGAGRAAGLLVALGGLALVIACSLAIGARSVPLGTVVDALLHYDVASNEQLIVNSLRAPRTWLGLEVGVALGLAGAAMQGLTRNPLADPGLLGVNAGAAFAVVFAFTVFGIATLLGTVWFAFAGAAFSSVLVYSVGSLGRDGATPVKLALAGVAATAALGSLTSLLLLRDIDAVGFYSRTWLVGSLAGRTGLGGSIIAQALPFIAVGAVMALVSGRLLNALALGDDVARSLGQRVERARAFSATSVVILAGTAVAAAGPIVFVGLVIPHVARAITGPDYRWVLPYSAVLGAVLMLSADVVGRVISRPGELAVGIMTVLVGAPFFIAFVRRRKLAEL